MEIRYYIFDKDGTLMRSKSGNKFVTKAEDQELIPGVMARLEELRIVNPNAIFMIATNQGGVAHGFMTIKEAAGIVNDAIRAIGGTISVFCPEDPTGTVAPYNVASVNRKPAPGMLVMLMHEAQAEPEEVMFVGDRPEDAEAAKAAGVQFAWADDFFGRTDVPA